MPHFSVAQFGEIKITNEKKIDKIIELKINSNKSLKKIFESKFLAAAKMVHKVFYLSIIYSLIIMRQK